MGSESEKSKWTRRMDEMAMDIDFSLPSIPKILDVQLLAFN